MTQRSLLSRFAADRRGATAVEYGLIAALIFVTILGAVTALGLGAGGSFDTTSQTVTAAIGGGGGGDQDD